MNRPINADSFWTYENGVLKNKLNIKNQDELDSYEMKMISSKIGDVTISNFKKEDFINLHKFLYDDLYEFAGTIRNENVVYNGLMMCQYEVIDLCLTDLFDKSFVIDSFSNLAKALAYFYSELMIIFPFRDGNEATIRCFLENYCKWYGYDLDFNNIDNNYLNDALIHAFYHDSDRLACIFEEYIKS